MPVTRGRGRVCLKKTASDTTTSGTSYFDDAISPTAVSRSTVLSSMAVRGRRGTLPATVQLPDLKTWNNAILADEETRSRMGFEAACSVLKVAYALGDSCLDEWINLASGILVKRAQSHSRCQNDTEVSTSLSHLPSHLERCVLAPATSERHQLMSLLDMLPSHQHATVAAATITPQRSLSATFDDHSLKYIKAIASIQASPDHLLSLTVHDGTKSWKTGQWEKAAPCLAEALQRHSKLTSLRISALCDIPDVQALAPAIAGLTSLQTLHLGTESAGISTDAVSELAIALQNLPALKELSLVVDTVLAPYRHKKRRLVTVHNPFHQWCLSDMLSSVTTLTSLDITVPWRCQHANFTAMEQFTLLNLRHLGLSGFSCDDANTVIVQLHAHLDTLIVRNLRPRQPEDSEVVPLFCDNLKYFHRLKRLEIGRDNSAPRRSADCPHLEVEDSIAACLPLTLGFMSRLRHLHLAVNLFVVACAMPVLADGITLASLRSLELHCWSAAVDGERAVLVFAELLTHVRTMQLEHLCLDAGLPDLETADDHGYRAGACPGMRALRVSTHLTSVRLLGWPTCLRHSRDLEAVGSMGRLVGVAITGMDVPPSAAAACVRCLALLPCLEELALGSIARRSVDAFLHAFRAQADTMEIQEGDDKGSWRAWPKLQRLALDLSAEHVANMHGEMVVRRAVLLPALRELMIGGCSAGEEAVPPSLRPGISPDRQAQADQLTRVAADAGVKLSFDWDMERLMLQSGSGVET